MVACAPFFECTFSYIANHKIGEKLHSYTTVSGHGRDNAATGVNLIMSKKRMHGDKSYSGL